MLVLYATGSFESLHHLPPSLREGDRKAVEGVNSLSHFVTAPSWREPMGKMRCYLPYQLLQTQKSIPKSSYTVNKPFLHRIYSVNNRTDVGGKLVCFKHEFAEPFMGNG